MENPKRTGLIIIHFPKRRNHTTRTTLSSDRTSEENQDMLESFTILLMGFGMIVLLIICLALLGIVAGFYIVLGIAVLLFVCVLLRVLWFWFVKGMTSILPKESNIQKWFEERYLDERYPSRVRRRRNAKRKMKELTVTS